MSLYSSAKPANRQKLSSITGAKSASNATRLRSQTTLKDGLPMEKKSRTTLTSGQKDKRSSEKSTRSAWSGGSANSQRSAEPAESDDLDEGQEIKFTNVPSFSDKLKDICGDEVKHSTVKRIFPKEILANSQESEYNRVYEIDLHADHIVQIENLEKFSKLRSLDLSCNYIERIDNLDVMPDLRELKLYNNLITEISGLDKLKELVTLQLHDNKLKQIGKGLQNQRKLKMLRLDGNYLHKLDVRELAGLGQLTSLDVSNNRLDNIAPISCLPRLEELFLVNNRLRTVADLSRCKLLQEVDVSKNRLTDLSGLKSLPKLTVIHASHNQLSNMKSLGKLKCLAELHISHNRLVNVKPVTDLYPALQYLDLAENHVELWDEVCTLSGLSEIVELYVSGNPFSLEFGEKPHYFHDLQKVIPQLDILDGAHTKNYGTKAGTPLMRPMSASSAVSSRQVEGQLRSLEDQLVSFENTLSLKFDSLRVSFGSLPAESPYSDQHHQPPSRMSTARPMSKCSQRSRIKAAQEYAAQVDQE